MNRSVKLIFLTILSILAISTQRTFASEVKQTFSPNEIIVEIQSPYSSEYNGELFIFNTLEEKNLFDEFKAQENARSFNPIQTRVTLVRTNNVGRKWINYNPLTPNWSKSSSYSITTNDAVTVSGSFSYKGTNLGISATLSRGVAINIPANPSRYSRLGVEADIQVKEYKVEYYDVTNSNRVVRTSYSKIPTVINTYNVVKYQ